MKGCGKAHGSDSNRKQGSMSPIERLEALSSDNDDSPILDGHN